MTALNPTELIQSQLFNHFSLEHLQIQCAFVENPRALQPERQGLHFAFQFLSHTKLKGTSFNLSKLSFLICEIPSSQAWCNKPKRWQIKNIISLFLISDNYTQCGNIFMQRAFSFHWVVSLE